MSIREMPIGSRALAVEPGLNSDPKKDERAASLSYAEAPGQGWTFDSMYQSYASFVWRNARRFGVPVSAAEDVMQEVFLVAYRRLLDFDARTSARAWLSAILIRVVRAYRRGQGRKNPGRDADAAGPVEPDRLIDDKGHSPEDAAERDDAVRELYAVLALMKEERREVLVLSEIEELTAPEIAHALGVNINTVYWRLRTARREFERIVLRRRAGQEALAR